eukprot:gnl/TRDRNA2_/TRDRNA2_32524_c0_seq1.p1 gnl/TRDRNA2_/TRDRNA2_32524_c0~~gnl/TRDRNA2_/TRDRNA2_32524_c0_seq1.p1  ORF type:complete len:320 (+),score=42.58 gnl/TRDRNA2_/TRDRNA2_32524_c0_seq1:132-1091(+)
MAVRILSYCTWFGVVWEEAFVQGHINEKILSEVTAEHKTANLRGRSQRGLASLVRQAVRINDPFNSFEETRAIDATGEDTSSVSAISGSFEQKSSNDITAGFTAEDLQALEWMFDQQGNSTGSIAEDIQAESRKTQVLLDREVASFLTDLDISGDSKLSMQELKLDTPKASDDEDNEDLDTAHFRALEVKKFRIADSNMDGLLDDQELPSLFHPETHAGAVALMAIETKDMNGDGMLSLSEVKANGSARHVENANGIVKHLATMTSREFDEMDTDTDGKLNRTELALLEYRGSEGQMPNTAEEYMEQLRQFVKSRSTEL